MEAPLIADLFAYPCHIAGDAEEVTLTIILTREAWIRQLSHLLNMYREIGFSSAHILSLKTTGLSPRLIQAVVHWRLRDASGHSLYDFRAMYTLAKTGSRFRIVAISHDEVTRYREYLAKSLSQN